MKRTLLIAATAAMILTGCASQDASAPTNPAENQASPAPSAESELASVIAEYEPSWSEAGESLAECRMIWAVDSQDDPISEIKGSSCYLRESTAIANAKLAKMRLEKLSPPPSQEELVARTTNVLGLLADIDLEKECGSGAWPEETAECNTALGSSKFALQLLDPVLDAWKPYL